MVVEDHGFQRRMAMRLLSELGVSQIGQAADGGSALYQLERRSAPVDVVMVDLDMPGMDGIEFIGRLSKSQLARSVLVVSALDPALLIAVQTMARAYGLHVLGCVEKPLTRDKLAHALAAFDDRVEELPVDSAIEVAVATVREALTAGEIMPWFQPQARFGSGKVVGVEALARWRRPDGTMVQPSRFIPVVEREGLVDTLTDHILTHACRWKHDWDDQGLHLNLSVNVSPSTLTDAGAADRYQKIVESQGVDPGEVVLELTESSVMSDAASGLSVLARLRLKGFGLSIDDFGTGYSSLAQLSQIPFTELKIDQGFVAGARDQPRKRAVIEASLDLARKLELEVVAEGVETLDEWQMLAEMDCGMAQGYLISAPVIGTELSGVVSRWRSPEM